MSVLFYILLALLVPAVLATVVFVAIAIFRRAGQYAQLAVATAALCAVLITSCIHVWDRYLDIPKLLITNDYSFVGKQQEYLIYVINVVNNGSQPATNCRADLTIFEVGEPRQEWENELAYLESHYVGNFELTWRGGIPESTSVVKDIYPYGGPADLNIIFSEASLMEMSDAECWVATALLTNSYNQYTSGQAPVSECLRNIVREGLEPGEYELRLSVRSDNGAYDHAVYELSIHEGVFPPIYIMRTDIEVPLPWDLFEHR
jgi:hypothetical protein